MVTRDKWWERATERIRERERGKMREWENERERGKIEGVMEWENERERENRRSDGVREWEYEKWKYEGIFMDEKLGEILL